MSDQAEEASPPITGIDPTNGPSASSSVAPPTPQEVVVEDALSFKVRSSSGTTHSISISESASVLDVKNLLAHEDREGIPVERQRLIYSGRVLKNDDSLATYRIKAGNTIHLVRSAASNQPAALSASSSSPASAASGARAPSSMAAGTANNFLAGLTGARFAGHAHLPNREMFGPDGGLGPPQTITQIMQDPEYRRMLAVFLDNPEFINRMIDMNPMLRNIPNAREILRSPAVRDAMLNPETFNILRGLQPQNGGASAFPAPGATDNTPADAPSASSADQANGPASSFFPGGIPPEFLQIFNTPNGAADADGTAATVNPFLTLMARSGMPDHMHGLAPTGTAPTNDATTPLQNHLGQPPQGLRNMLAEAIATTGEARRRLEILQQAYPRQGYYVDPPREGRLPSIAQLTDGPLWQPMGAGRPGATPAPSLPLAPPDNTSLEVRYEAQLRQLNEMGFYDFDRNVTALRRSGGNVQGAIEFLLGNS